MQPTCRRGVVEPDKRCASETMPSNKRMKLTKLSAAPGWSPTTVWTEVPAHARAGRIDAGTASQLIRGVLRTLVASGADERCGASLGHSR
jgi:hypothetical protein